jgi:hypothetical protein
MRLIMLVAALGLFAGGCGGGATHRSLEGTAFTVSVPANVQSAARARGVDLRRLVVASADKAFVLLPHHGRIEIAVEVNPEMTIPEIGVGGFADPRTGNVTLSVDPSRVDLRHVLETWIPDTVAHELHHSSRVRVGPGYGVTLGQAIVSEGLADRFSYEVFPHTPPKPWDHALTKAQEHTFWLQARPLLNSRGYSFSDWFFGSGGKPRWGGFTLGYDITGRYLTEHHQTPSDAVTTPAAKILASFDGG